ncbi:MAG: replicative DNA helicase, partial [Parasporobacterium sp.]|nr:replicative DNA helicase [Parasporobacterium sp.]
MEDEALIKKIMPHSIEAEQSVIGSMLMDPEAIDAASELLTPEDFYVRQNGLLFQCITEIHNEGKPADEVTLSARLQEKGAPEEMLSVDFARSLLEVVPSSANV